MVGSNDRGFFNSDHTEQQQTRANESGRARRPERMPQRPIQKSDRHGAQECRKKAGAIFERSQLSWQHFLSKLGEIDCHWAMRMTVIAKSTPQKAPVVGCMWEIICFVPRELRRRV